jgi:5'(3')-deoxyribonucleotidase
MQIFLDCDGVLADFNREFYNCFDYWPQQYEETFGTSAFWKTVNSNPTFYENLPMMWDARELVSAVEKISVPIILTGIPSSVSDSANQKINWKNKHFPHLKMICCLSRNKRLHSQPGDILIDDMLKYSHLWKEAGGVFIHHTSAKTSIEKLTAHLNMLNN